MTDAAEATRAPTRAEGEDARSIVILQAGIAGARRAQRGSEGFRRLRSRLTLTAYHESAHVVVALACGRRVFEVNVIPSGTRAGYTAVEMSRCDGIETLEEANASDRKRIAARCFRLAPGWRGALLLAQELREEAEHLVNLYSFEVMKLAGELEKRKSLDEAEIETILGVRVRQQGAA